MIMLIILGLISFMILFSVQRRTRREKTVINPDADPAGTISRQEIADNGETKNDPVISDAK
jgi:hypothetical protein